MMASNEPHFLSRKFENHLRQQSARGANSYVCPFCNDGRSFQREPNLWAHIQSSHSDQLPAAQDEQAKSELRKWLKQHAVSKMPATNSQKRSKNEKGHATRSQAPKISSADSNKDANSAAGLSKQPEATSDLSDIAQLSLEHGSDGKGKEGSRPANSRMRQAGRERITAEESSTIDTTGPRRSRTRSHDPRLRPAVVDPEFDRNAPLYGGTGDGYSRPRSNPKKLFDPNLDSPTVKIDSANLMASSRMDSKGQNLREREDHSRRRRMKLPSADQEQSTMRLQPAPKKRPARKQPNNIPPKPIQGSGQKERGLHYKLAEGQNYEMFLQPQTQPITEEQLAAELKSIYAALEMAEAKVVEVDNHQVLAFRKSQGERPQLRPEVWMAYFDLHRALLYEHHDFFLASQHPSASLAQRRLATRHAMPARMWKFGIHAFLEILRGRLPEFLDLMLSFIYAAYSMVGLLLETVPIFETTWIECLGDLARYRMAIEEADLEARENWTVVSREWYCKAADRLPHIGRLYHHLAILARPDVVQQSFLYTKALSVVQPFVSARESILSLFEMISRLEENQRSIGHTFVQAHGILFSKGSLHGFPDMKTRFLDNLDGHIEHVTKNWREQGIYIAVSNFAAVFGFFGAEDPALIQRFRIEDSNSLSAEQSEHPETVDSICNYSPSFARFRYAKELAFSTLRIVLQRVGDANVLPHVHVSLIFLYHLFNHNASLAVLAADTPWDALVPMLNYLVSSAESFNWMDESYFPALEGDDRRPLPEDYHLRGILWTNKYFPDDWFTDIADKDDFERYTEQPSMTANRATRILWLAYQISKSCDALNFNIASRNFSTPVTPNQSHKRSSIPRLLEAWAPEFEPAENEDANTVQAAAEESNSPFRSPSISPGLDGSRSYIAADDG